MAYQMSLTSSSQELRERYAKVIILGLNDKGNAFRTLEPEKTFEKTLKRLTS